MLNKHKLQRIAIATSALMAFGTTQLIANADTLTITGNIQGPTCSLSTSSGGPETKTFTLALPTVALSGATSGATAGAVFGAATTTTFSLTAAGGQAACNFAGGASGWDMFIVPAKTGFITNIGGSTTYLSNMIDQGSGGTNAVVKLLGGIGSTGTNELALTDAGTYASGGSTPFRALSTSSIALTAQFAQPVANQRPSSGNFSSTLTLGVNYR